LATRSIPTAHCKTATRENVMRTSPLLAVLGLFFIMVAPAHAIDLGPLENGPLPAPYAPKHVRGPFDYVIVTTRELAPEFDRLAKAHDHDGFHAGIWTLESIRSAYPAGRDDAERIRMFLQDAHRELDTRWLLIGGNARRIPIRIAKLDVNFPPPYDALQHVPTDQYYACLDGTWNADGDDVWGELATDDVDLVPELIVGRAPVDSRDEAQRFVDKTLDALKSNKHPGVRTSRVLLAAELLNGGLVDFGAFGEHIRPLFEAAPNTEVTRLYENSSAWPGSLPESRQSLIAELNEGYDLAVLYGAGSNTQFSAGVDGPVDQYLDSDAGAMRNTHATIVCFVSASVCRPEPAVASIGERMINARPGQGASAVLGPTSIEFVGGNDQFVRKFFERVYQQGVVTIGEALTQTIIANAFPSDTQRLSTQGMILYGDPALPMNPPAQIQTVAATTRADDGLAAIPSSLTLELRTPTVTADVASGGAEFSLRVVSANPARTEAKLELSLPAALAAQRPEVGVYDLAGRQVRMLDGSKRTLSWDLRDEAGIVVVPGIYFINVRVAGHTATRRVTVMR